MEKQPFYIIESWSRQKISCPPLLGKLMTNYLQCYACRVNIRVRGHREWTMGKFNISIFTICKTLSFARHLCPIVRANLFFFSFFLCQLASRVLSILQSDRMQTFIRCKYFRPIDGQNLSVISCYFHLFVGDVCTIPGKRQLEGAGRYLFEGYVSTFVLKVLRFAVLQLLHIFVSLSWMFSFWTKEFPMYWTNTHGQAAEEFYSQDNWNATLTAYVFIFCFIFWWKFKRYYD